MRNQKGFTLIELVFVIVILGILAAFAIPRFTDLSTQARVSSITSVLGSTRAASAQARAAAIATNVERTATGTVTVDGGTVALVYGHPDNTAAGIGVAVEESGEYTFTAGTATTAATFSLNSAATPANCAVSYQNNGTATNPSALPTINVTTNGC